MKKRISQSSGKTYNGIPKMQDCLELIQTEYFHDLEDYSNAFIDRNKNLLNDYSNRWVPDPLHNWSRIWEYPYIIDILFKALKGYSERVTILDAGSGCTFLPYFLSDNLNADIHCCDSDQSLENTFNNINYREGKKIKFTSKPLINTEFEEEYFDFIYCISVLEHDKNRKEIIKEMYKILKPNGTFMLTFDISLDGDGEIPIEDAEGLLNEISLYFSIEGVSNNLKQTISREGILTTSSIYEYNSSYLNWKKPTYIDFIKNCLLKKKSNYRPPMFTILCCSCKKLNLGSI